ncbi:hypothetical protein AB1Y20_016071 [Prymnesium parvum]|uniref:Leucine-rich repeat domain-containing protein n=1 Tax=Prymnesium parvum TaxID=97485 RepID=A0AB34JYY6_PRYPA
MPATHDALAVRTARARLDDAAASAPLLDMLAVLGLDAVVDAIDDLGTLRTVSSSLRRAGETRAERAVRALDDAYAEERATLLRALLERAPLRLEVRTPEAMWRALAVSDALAASGVGAPVVYSGVIRDLEALLAARAAGGRRGGGGGHVARGRVAFGGCGANLYALRAPEGVTDICDAACTDRPRLREVALPRTMCSIGADAFARCVGLAHVRGARAAPGGRDVAPLPFDVDATARELGARAFVDCARLRDVALPPHLERIGERAFAQCSALRDVVLPPALVAIGEAAFVRCRALRSIALPARVEAIGKRGFALSRGRRTLSAAISTKLEQYHAVVDARRNILGIDEAVGEWGEYPFLYHIKSHPERFLRATWLLSRERETQLDRHGNTCSGFALFPLRRRMVPRHVDFCQEALREVLRLGSSEYAKKSARAKRGRHAVLVLDVVDLPRALARYCDSAPHRPECANLLLGTELVELLVDLGDFDPVGLFYRTILLDSMCLHTTNACFPESTPTTSGRPRLPADVEALDSDDGPVRRAYRRGAA